MSGRNRPVRWTEGAKTHLLGLTTDQQLREAFPYHSLSYLRRLQSKFQRERASGTADAVNPARDVRPDDADSADEVPRQMLLGDRLSDLLGPGDAEKLARAIALLPEIESEDALAELMRQLMRQLGLQAMAEMRSEDFLDEEDELSDEERQEQVDAEVAKRDRQIDRLKGEITAMRRLYKRQVGEAAGIEALISAIESTVPQMEPVPIPILAEPSGKIDEEDLVVLFSDWHIGEVVDPEQTSGFSAYNVDIARRRIMATVDKIISIATEKLSNYHFPRVHVFLLGDLVSGIIHDELRVNDEVGIVEQCILATEILVEAIAKLAMVFPEVRVTSVVGNHGRVTEEKYFKGKAHNNYDYLVSIMAQKIMVNQTSVTWTIPRSFFTVAQVRNRRFLLFHGDVIKSWMGIPWYGLSRAYFKWHALHADYGVQFSDMIVAHFHNPNRMTMERSEVIVNGCTKGGDEYSIGAISAACDPSQTMFGVHDKVGITHYWIIKTAEIM